MATIHKLLLLCTLFCFMRVNATDTYLHYKEFFPQNSSETLSIILNRVNLWIHEMGSTIIYDSVETVPRPLVTLMANGELPITWNQYEIGNVNAILVTKFIEFVRVFYWDSNPESDHTNTILSASASSYSSTDNINYSSAHTTYLQSEYLVSILYLAVLFYKV
jgi:hypothetical protein